MVFWRVILAILGLLMLGISVNDAYQIVTSPGVFSLTVGVLHGLFFLALGSMMTYCAVRDRGENVRELTIDFLRDVVARKNLAEAGLLTLIALAAAFVLATPRHP